VRRGAGILAAAVLAAALPLPALAEGMPTYQKRLHLPFARDDLGFSRAVAADLATGEIFVSDWRGNRIAIFDRRGRFRYLIPGGRVFSSAMDLAIHPEGYIYVLPGQGDRVEILDFDGAGLGRVAPRLPDDGEWRPPRLVSFALSPAGDRLFFLDEGNYRLWITRPTGELLGSVDFTADRDQEALDDLILSHVDVYGETVLVSIMTDAWVYLYDLDGTPRGYVGRRGTAACQTALPIAAALDSQGRVVILDNQRALGMLWDPETNRCLGEFSGFGNSPGALYRPSDMALDGEGRIYIGQGYQGRLQVYKHDSPAAGAPAPAIPGTPAPSSDRQPSAPGSATEQVEPTGSSPLP
jgi:sugar lactone lactonase YvrE